MLIAPVAVILVAENLGHLKAVAGMTGRNMDPYMDGHSSVMVWQRCFPALSAVAASPPMLKISV